MPSIEDLAAQLDRIEAHLLAIRDEGPGRSWYTTAEFARLVGKAEFTVREWCRLGRVRAEKQASGRGSHPAWVISQQELERYRQHGLLPLRAG